jgi:hypothetical protein
VGLGEANVTVISDNAATVMSVGTWVLKTASSIPTVAPSSGHVRTVIVQITGTTLFGLSGGLNVSKVALAGVDARIVNASATTVYRCNGGFGSGDAVVTANSGAEAARADARLAVR